MNSSKDIKLHYDTDYVTFSVPEDRIAEIIRPWHNQLHTDNKQILHNALSAPNLQNFRRASSGKKLCVLLPDATRDMPIFDILPFLNNQLKECSFIRFMVCTGTHNSWTPGNIKLIADLEKMAVLSGLKDFDVQIQDCQADDFIAIGISSRGTEIEYNRKIESFDLFLVLSDVKFHYFAGYSNPVKYFAPGVTSYLTTQGNHSLALDIRSSFGNHPWHSDPARRNNPLANDQLECMQKILAGREVFALVTISTGGQIQWASIGNAETVSRQAFDIADKTNMRKVKPVKYLIVSPGGHPNDCDLYISQRALELTKQAVLEGGEILFVSACPQGIGAERTMENFYNRLTQPLEQILKSIKGEYKLFTHKPYKFAELINRLSRIWVYSELPDKMVKDAHLCPAGNIQNVVDKWVINDPQAKIMIVDGANKLALYRDRT